MRGAVGARGLCHLVGRLVQEPVACTACLPTTLFGAPLVRCFHDCARIAERGERGGWKRGGVGGCRGYGGSTLISFSTAHPLAPANQWPNTAKDAALAYRVGGRRLDLHCVRLDVPDFGKPRFISNGILCNCNCNCNCSPSLSRSVYAANPHPSPLSVSGIP